MGSEAISTLMWENNPQTPINASNLSEMIDFSSEGKFILKADENNLDTYEQWADMTLSVWPDIQADGFDASPYLNKLIYNTADKTARSLLPNVGQTPYVWQYLPSPYNKILHIKARTRISSSYLDINNERQITSFDFGEEDQIFTIDELLDGDDFATEEKYLIYLYVKHSYNDTARVKILRASDESLDYWKNDYEVESSPTGNNLISYRKIGGFKTDSNGYVVEDSIWDLYSYKEEIIANTIKVWENGESRPLSAADFTVIDDQNLFSSAGTELSVEEALFQTRALVNNLNDRLYTNRRVGLNLQFSHVLLDNGVLESAPVDAVTLRLTPGFIDVLGTQVSKSNTTYFADPSVGFRINEGEDLVYNARLISEDDGSGDVLYPGVWRVFIDFNGVLTLRHEISENSNPVWISSYYGWFDLTGKRCIGKFRVKADSGNYIEKYSVTDTFDINAPTNSIHHHFGTLCPDGLIPCDGKWHDVTGRDVDVYEFEELPAVSSWGNSWYEEAPNWMNRAVRGFDIYNSVITGGPYNPLTNEGGADDYSIMGGSETHTHDFPHGHRPGTLNVVPSGVHPGEHQVDFNGGVAYVEVNTVNGGQRVATADHEHNMTITGGLHTHSSDNFEGRSEVLSGGEEETQASSSWSPYRGAIICIKKI
jgi:hypothetical protein